MTEKKTEPRAETERRATTRDRVRRHVAALVTAAATATLATTACACDPMPPPATPQIDVQSLEVQALWVEEENGTFLEITIKPLASQGPVAFDDTLAELKGAMVVTAHGGESLILRLRVEPGASAVSGNIEIKTSYAKRRAKLEITPGAQPVIGASVRAWLTEIPG